MTHWVGVSLKGTPVPTVESGANLSRQRRTGAFISWAAAGEVGWALAQQCLNARPLASWAFLPTTQQETYTESLFSPWEFCQCRKSK